ncbi:hypothetical protein FN846DRAFT_912731 [Sphaerosporella brunnea]|uniref:Uncharacterized protein n=1 Tax=Sphaerosporella brunnea TaxID=1250544 RepID=A0A5J5EGT7_9PEZI|nr:hypothetical protein FN846DRAFT_912731 [Sphaerosporella brunnea]
MSFKTCDICRYFGNEGNFARHMRQVHHMYCCHEHMQYVKAAHYVTKRTGRLECGCYHRLRIGAGSADWWRTWMLAKASLVKCT